MAIIMCKEMKKLRKYLTDNGIEWYDDTSISATWWMVRTKYKYKGREFSVINGFGSFGGYTSFTNKNMGKLELIIDGEEPIGYLSAEDVVEIMNEMDN